MPMPSSPIEQARQRLRRQWGLPEGDESVLLAYVGRLDHEKGIGRAALGH